MNIMIESPLIFATIYTLLNVSLTITFAFACCGILWKLLIKPKIESKQDQINSQRQQIEHLKSQLENQKVSELIAMISGLNEAIAINKEEISSLNIKLRRIKHTDEQERKWLERRIDFLSNMVRDYSIRISRIEHNEVIVIAGQEISQQAGIMLQVRNLRLLPVNVHIVIEGTEETLVMHCPPAIVLPNSTQQVH